MMGNLFNKYYISEYVNDYRKALSERIDKLEITENTNVPELVERLVDEFTIFPIEIGQPQPSQPKEITRQIRNDWGQMYSQKIVEVFVTIPFEGNHNLFYCMSSHSTIVYLDKGVSINRTNITATITLTQFDETAYFSEVNKIIGTLKTNLPTIHSDEMV